MPPCQRPRSGSMSRRPSKGLSWNRSSLRPQRKTIQEQTVLRLFEQGEISSGYGAALLGMTRYDFMLLLGKRGIPFFNLTEEELAADAQAAQAARQGAPKGRKRKP